MPLTETTRAGFYQECIDCGKGIEPETDYAIWADEERQQEILLCLSCAKSREWRRQQRLEAQDRE